jgi:CHASE3 domain
MNELDVTIATRREKGFDAALAIVNTDTGRIAMEAVEADIDAIIDAADVRLQARMATAESLEQHVTLTFLIGSIIAACALIAGAFLLARAYRRAALSEGVLQATLDSVREGSRHLMRIAACSPGTKYSRECSSCRGGRFGAANRCPPA